MFLGRLSRIHYVRPLNVLNRPADQALSASTRDRSSSFGESQRAIYRRRARIGSIAGRSEA